MASDDDAFATAHSHRPLPRALLTAGLDDAEEDAAELDALVARLRADARAQASSAAAAGGEGGAGAGKRRTYGRASGLKKLAPLVPAPEDAPAAAGDASAREGEGKAAHTQKLFGSSSLTTLPTSDGRPASSSQPQALRLQRSDASEDGQGVDSDGTVLGSSARRPSTHAQHAPTSPFASSDEDDALLPAQRRNPRASAASRIVPRSSSTGRSLLPSPDKPAPSSPAVARAARPPLARPARKHPLGLGPADDALAGAPRVPSPEIGEFGPSPSPSRTSSSGGGGGGGGARSLFSSPARPTPAPAPAPRPKAKGKRRALVASSDEDGDIRVPRAEMAGVAGFDPAAAGGSGGEDSDGEGGAWVGDVVQSVKDRRRGKGGAKADGPPQAKGLSKKELEQMKLEQARMQRERKTVIDKPEQETRDMLTFLRRKREAAQARKSLGNPLDTQRFFRASEAPHSTPPPPTWSTAKPLPGATPSARAHAAVAAAADDDDISSDPIVSSNPALASRPATAARPSLGGAAARPSEEDDDDDDGADEFADVAALFERKKAADAAKRESLRAFKERAAALAAAAAAAGGRVGDKGKGKVEESSDDELEIEPSRPPPAAQAHPDGGPDVRAKTNRSTLVHRNLAKFGVVPKHGGRLSSGSLAPPPPPPAGGAGLLALSGSTGSPARARPRPTESQIQAAGTTFGHGSSSPSSAAGPAAAAGRNRPAGSKAHHARAVSRADLALNLLAKAKAQTRRAIAEKDAKYGRGVGAGAGLDERWRERTEVDWEGLMEGAQVRKSDWILVADDGDEDGEDEDDEDDEDFDPDAAEGAGDEAAADAADEDGSSAGTPVVAAEGDGGGAGSDAGSPARTKPGRLLDPADAANGVLDPMEAEDSDADAAAAAAAEDAGDLSQSDKENSLPLGSQRPPLARAGTSSGVLAEREPSADAESEGDDNSEDESFPMVVRAKRRRTVLLDDDDDDEGESQGRSQLPPPPNRLGSPLAESQSSPSKRHAFGAPLSPSPSPTGSPRTSTATKLGSTNSAGAAFGADDDAFAGGDGFGTDGGFSQFFEPTQLATATTASNQQGPTAEDGSQPFGGEGSMDLDGEGFSQFFGQTQPAAAAPKVAAANKGLNHLRALQDAPLRPELSQLPAPDVSDSQRAAAADALARDADSALDGAEEDESQEKGRKMYINRDGFFTQTEPSTYAVEETPDRPTQHHPLTTPATPSVHHAGLQLKHTGASAASSSSPAKPMRRLVRRQDLSRTAVDDDEALAVDEPTEDEHEQEEEEESVPPAPAPAKLAPMFLPASERPQAPKPPRPRATTAQMRELLEAEAVESDEDDGFGAFGKTRDSDDEKDDEDDDEQNKIVEGLVNDEQMTADAEKLADEERARLARELAEQDDEAQLKIAQDVTTGEFRKKKKDALSMEMDSDEENYGTSKRSREERRRKRKLDKLDEMERLEVDPETAPFAKMYADTYNNDADDYGNLLSDDNGEDEGADSDSNDFAESLGIEKPKHHHRRRIVASPEPLDRRGSGSFRLYEDGSDLEDETESQLQIRRGSSKHRPQAHPLQQDDEAYSLGVTTGYSNSDQSLKQDSQSRRAKLESFARDESQNTAAARGGSTASVTGLKRKPSAASLRSDSGGGGSQGSNTRRKVSNLVATGSSGMLKGINKKWES